MDLPPDISREVVFGAEARLPSALVFSAKEAVYKAVFPLTGEVWPFDAVRIAQSPKGASATLRRTAGRFRPGDTFDVTLLRERGLLLTFVSLGLPDRA